MASASQSVGASLPELPRPPAHEMRGPTPWSNWAIPGRVIAGAYPASPDDAETDHVLTTLLELGTTTFVCLQAEVNIHIPEHAWRAGSGLRPYVRDAQRLLSRAQEANSSRIAQRKIDFLHLPIIDGSVTTDQAMSRLADDCCERVLRGEKLYIHCWGGHGRTGTLVATMLGRLYGLPYSQALRLTQVYHDSRVYPQGVRSPQTAVQRAQVRRLLVAPASAAGLAAGATPAAAAARSVAGSSLGRMPGPPSTLPASFVRPATHVAGATPATSSSAGPLSWTTPSSSAAQAVGGPAVTAPLPFFGIARTRSSPATAAGVAALRAGSSSAKEQQQSSCAGTALPVSLRADSRASTSPSPLVAGASPHRSCGGSGLLRSSTSAAAAPRLAMPIVRASSSRLY